MKLGDYGRLSGSKCGALRINAMLGNSHDFPARLPGANQYASPSAMYLEALRFIWAHKRSHQEWYGMIDDIEPEYAVNQSYDVELNSLAKF